MTKRINAAVKMPQSNEECAQAIAAYKREGIVLEAVETALDKKIALANEQAEEKAGPARARREALRQVIQSYCEVHRIALTGGLTRKSYKFTTGSVHWNLGTLVVEFDKTKEGAIISSVKSRGYKDCLKTSVKLVLPAVKKLPTEIINAIDGLTLKRKPETFTIKPYEGKVDVKAEPKAQRGAA